MDKICIKCDQELPLSDFNKSGNSYRGQCRVCQKLYWKQWRENNKDKRVAWANKAKQERYWFAKNLQRIFNMTVEQYDNIYEAQGGVCAICEQPETRIGRNRNGETLNLAVDHDRKTGNIRELLCGACNTSLGLLREDTKILNRMINYIEKHKPVG